MKHSARFLAIVEDARQRVAEIDVDTVRRRVADEHDPLIVIDVREESEWEAGYLPGALHLSKGVIERDVERTLPDTAVEIVLYCAGGYRSVLAADALRAMGYANVRSMTGGIRAWREARGPLAFDDG